MLCAGLSAQNQSASSAQTSTAQPAVSANFEMPKSHNPLNAYAPDSVPEPVLSNSPRLEQLVRDGKLYLSLERCH